MRKLIIGIATALCASATFAVSPAATQAWVANALRTNNLALAASTRSSTSNGVITASAGEGDGQVQVRVEEFGDAALFVTNSVTAIANGTIFVWNGRGEYVNPVGTVVSTRTNLFWGVIGSHFTNGVSRFDGAFDVKHVMITKSMSLAITNGMNEAFNAAPRKWYERVADVLASIIIPCANAAAPQSAEGWYNPGDYENLVGEYLFMDFWDAKAKMYVPVNVEVSTTDSKTHYVTKEAIEKAFSDLTVNVNTALYAVGAALDGIVEVSDWIAWNNAAIKKLGENLYAHAVVDLKSKDGSLSWSVAGSSGGGGTYSPPKYEVRGYDNGWFRLFKDNSALAPAWFGLPGGTSGVPVQVDAKSIATNTHGQIEVAGFEKISPKGVSTFANQNGSPLWYNMVGTNGVSIFWLDDYHLGFGFDNWKTPEGTCDENLGEILTGKTDEKDTDHYVLTRYKDEKLHYMKIGRTGLGGGSALTVFGCDEEGFTSSETIGSGSVTNVLKFKSSQDSNVRVNIEKVGDNELTIEIGVFYR